MTPPNPKLPPGHPAASTRVMALRLAEIHGRLRPETTLFFNDRLSELLQSRLTNSLPDMERLEVTFRLGVQQMNSGRPDAALNTFMDLERDMAARGVTLPQTNATALRMTRGLAFLRLGEQENCLVNYNADSCLFPIRGRAVHLLPRGSRAAAAIYNEQLRQIPNDLTARWLLNIAYMTLGEYPDQVPSRFLIPPSKFASDHPMPRFMDISEGLGLDSNDLAGGVIVDDFDNDGFNDIMYSAWDAGGQLRYFRNNGNGTFTERTSEAGFVGEIGSLNIQQTDYNNDGLLDIWMLRGGWLGKSGRIPNSLLRNNGDGTFTDVTEEAGLLSYHPTQTSVWFDYDGDGWLDLFIGNEASDPRDPDFCELYHNNRDGTFTECARPAGIQISEFIKGVTCADYDNDGRPDLFLSDRRAAPKILLHNDGPDAQGQWRFSQVIQGSGITTTMNGFGTFFFDYNNDGWEDLVVFGYYLPNGVADIAAEYLGRHNFGTRSKLYRNKGDGTFADVSNDAKLNRILHTMGHNFGDLDNDGWLDFYCATGDPDLATLIPNLMFRNHEGEYFQDVTSATGTGHLQKGHAVAFADLDNDGAQDVYVSIGGAYTGDVARNSLFHNSGTTNHWVKFKLEGVKANRAAIGARLKLTVQTASGSRTIYRTVNSGGSFGSNPLRQEIGLGQATGITSLEIRWPGSETRQTVTGLEMDQTYRILEGGPEPQVVKIHRISFAKELEVKREKSATVN